MTRVDDSQYPSKPLATAASNELLSVLQDIADLAWSHYGAKGCSEIYAICRDRLGVMASDKHYGASPHFKFTPIGSYPQGRKDDGF